MDFSKNYYRSLGLQHTAGQEDIKKAFRAMALKYHPDKNNNSKFATEQFRMLKEAYEVLSDPIKKTQYDAVRRSFSVSPYAFSREFGSKFTEGKQAPTVEVEEETTQNGGNTWLKPIIFIVIAIVSVALIVYFTGKNGNH